MNLRQAIKTVENLRRYRKGVKKTYWDQSGPYVPQKLIPMATKTEIAKAERLMDTRVTKKHAVRWVDVSLIRSTQHCLRFRSLMWHVKHRDTMQRTFKSKDPDIKGVNLPIVVWVDGAPLLWNGNHRVTANILLGHKRILVRMYKRR